MFNVDVYNPKSVNSFVQTAADAQLEKFLDRCAETLGDSRFDRRGYAFLVVSRARSLAEEEITARRFREAAAA